MQTTTKTTSDARTGSFDHLLENTARTGAPLGPESRFFPNANTNTKRLQAFRELLGAWSAGCRAGRTADKAIAILA